MTTKNFNVKNGLTTGNILLDAASGNITTTNANLGNLAAANYFSGNGFYLTSIAGGNVLGQVGNALIAGTVYTNAQPNITSLGTLSSLTVSANATVGNIKTNNLLYANGDPYVFTTSAAGSNTQIQFNDGMAFAGSAGLTFDKGTGRLTVTGNINSGNVNTTSITGTLLTAVQTNITSVGTLGALSVTGNVTAGNVNATYFGGDGSLLTHITGGNVDGQVGNALVAGTVYTNAQPNITSVGTLTSLAVTANATVGNLTTAGIIKTTNTTDSTGTDTGALIVQGGASITKDLWVGGTIHAPNLDITTYNELSVDVPLLYLEANVPYPYSYDLGFYSHFALTGPEPGNGYQHTGFVRNHSDNAWYLFSNIAAEPSGGTVDLTDANLVYDAIKVGSITAVGNANVTGTLTAGAFTTSGASGNISGANYVIANYFSGDGSALTHITGGNVDGQVGNALVAGTVYTAAQPNITSVGTLTTLVVGNGTSNVTITTNDGNGFVKATGNITAPYFIGNVIGNISGTITVPGNDTAILYNQTGNAGASDNFKFNYTTNVLTVVGNIVGSNANLGNAVTANYFVGNGAFLTGLPAGYANADVAAYLPTYTGNLTAGNVSVTGTLSAGSITTSGTAGNISGVNYVTANYFSGNGFYLTNLVGANVSGAVSSATTAATVTTNAQPNITSVGTLTGLVVSGTANVADLELSGGIISTKSNISVTTNTVIDQFAPSSYRSAKYHISAKGTDGYQSAEVLLVHDGSTAYITIYGSLCSNNTADIVDFSSNINGVSGNVTLYATTASPSTTVNLVPIYIKD